MSVVPVQTLQRLAVAQPRSFLGVNRVPLSCLQLVREHGLVSAIAPMLALARHSPSRITAPSELKIDSNCKITECKGEIRCGLSFVTIIHDSTFGLIIRTGHDGA